MPVLLLAVAVTEAMLFRGGWPVLGVSPVKVSCTGPGLEPVY